MSRARAQQAAARVPLPWARARADQPTSPVQEGVMPGSVITGGARTPIGKLSGALKDFPAADLGSIAIKAALGKAGISGDQVDYVMMGHVLQAGAGQITARQAAVAGGIPMTVPAVTINKVCLSGLDAIALADQLIGYGEFEVVVAGGMESMTQAPHLLPQARSGYRLGSGELVDSMVHDGLFCAFDKLGMGAATETYTKLAQISREEQDAFSATSHGRAAAAMKNGVFGGEITPVPVPQRRGEPLLVSEDEGVRPETTPESLAKLRQAFASVAIQSMRELGIGEDAVNVNGGAIALGHPIGASGARIVLTLAHELRRRGGGTGAAGLCGGGGQGDALIIRVPAR